MDVLGEDPSIPSSVMPILGTDPAAASDLLLSASGGMLGIFVAVMITMLIGALVPALPSSVPTWAVVSAFTVSCAVGLFFGVWPAVKASRLDPVEALRYE